MRPRQPLAFAGAGLPVLTEFEVGENGLVTEKLVDYSQVQLPEVETTDLRACLDAGVNLKEVSSKILSPKEIVVDLASAPENVEPSEQGDEK